MVLTDRSFDIVTDFFESVSGIRLVASKRALVTGRLQRLAQARGDTDLDRYVEQVVVKRTDDKELARLVDRLTTNETYFFREPKHFELLTELAAEYRGSEPFRVWSAASSSGEEGYSIAMVLADKIGTRPWEVVGTDLSRAMVATARRGLYPVERARDLPIGYRKRFCLRGEGKHEGELLVSRELRDRVRFLPANLTQTLPEVGFFDVIFLRNVLIYFEADAKVDIVQRVARQLKPDGLLFCGHAESLGHLPTGLKTVRTAVYARP
ncbi:MAG: methyltransferase domain-containing protein [Burkholderiaceae bacterium]|nr:methyltransferase domain-containing protein [Burkholderiaceae bacterium]